MGVHIPTINTVNEAREAVKLCKYAPLGKRGLATVRAAGYGLRGALSEYCQKANEEILVVIHIEELEAIRNLDELLAVEGIDVYYLGPTDLSNSMGRPGRIDEEVQNIVDEAIRKIVRAGRVAGVISTDLKAAEQYLGMGVRYLATHAMHFLAVGSQSFLKSLRKG
jgi:4-hydroxy-2-oxoheptanedioate aldolase